MKPKIQKISNFGRRFQNVQGFESLTVSNLASTVSGRNNGWLDQRAVDQQLRVGNILGIFEKDEQSEGGREWVPGLRHPQFEEGRLQQAGLTLSC